MELPLSPTFNNDKSDCLQLKLTLITLFPLKKKILIHIFYYHLYISLKFYLENVMQQCINILTN